MKSSIPFVWGTSSEEQAMAFPGDKYVSNCEHVLFRGIDINAPPTLLFRWLCQLKISSYSYDWIENVEALFLEGRIQFRRSPEELTPGTEKLSAGQKVMDIFKILDFEVNRSLTLEMDVQSAVSFFGQTIVSYIIVPTTDLQCRLVAKICISYPDQLMLRWMKWFLPWGDFVMSRKQFLSLKRLSENTLSSLQSFEKP